MPRARIFISHSTKGELSPAEASARDVLQALTHALQNDDRFTILLDRITLQPGDAWRARINLWVGACDAAVVLLSEDALNSAYVSYEASILSYRRGLDPSLLVIPVLVPPVTSAALKASRLAPQQLAELQLVKGTTDEIVAQVMDVLGAAAYHPSPVERRAEQLAELLEKADDRDVIRAYEAVGLKTGLDVAPWLPQEAAHEGRQRRLRLAVQLMSVGMEGAAHAIRLLQGRMGHDWSVVQEIIDLVASSWVDYRSTTRIPPITRDAAGPRALALNASSRDTAWMYVVCAARNDPATGNEDLWYLAPTNGVAGERVVDDLEAELRRSLAQELGVGMDGLDNELEWLFGGQPVLAALPHTPSLTSEVLEELRRRLPHVTFFVLTGDSPGADVLRAAEVEFLVPELGEQDEETFLDAYDAMQARVRTRRFRQGG